MVPVIMARADVPMNGSLFPVEEMWPATWNGVPVTVGHPETGDQFESANQPGTLTEWAVGKIFNAAVDGLLLKGEAWIDVERAEKVRPGLVALIESGEPMDVSTGYFCDGEAARGVLNGKEYQAIDRAIRPDHLALLPDEEGACNWDDGCGVRSNKRGSTMALKVKEALAVLASALGASGKPKANARKAKRNEGEGGTDKDQIIADLIANEDTPFGPDDEAALQAMSDETLEKLATAEGEIEEEPAANEDDETPEGNEGEEEEPAANEGDDDEKPAAAKAKGNNKRGKPMAARTPTTNRIGLTADEMAAVAFMRKNAVSARAQLTAKITANSAISEADCAKMSFNTLETVANGLHSGSYAGRPVPTTNRDGADAVKAMTEGGGVMSALKARSAKKEAA